MRRIKLVFALGVVMAAMLALSAGPAMADDLEFDEGDVDVFVEDVDVDLECCFVEGDELVAFLVLEDLDLEVEEDFDIDDDDDGDDCDCDLVDFGDEGPVDFDDHEIDEIDFD